MTSKTTTENESSDRASRIRLIYNETKNKMKKLGGGRSQNENDEEEEEDEDENKIKSENPTIQIRTVYKSKRWILALTCLCLLLTATLIGSFIKYKRCCPTNSEYIRKNKENSVNCSNKRDSEEISTNSLELVEEEFEEKLNKNWNNSRLPENIKPVYYKIDLRIDVEQKEFSGSCTIKFVCLEQISFLVLHADTNIQFEHANYLPRIYETSNDSKLGRLLNLKSMTYNSFYTYLIIELNEGEFFRKKRNYTIVFENYQSQIKNDLKGIYYGTYNSKNVTKYTFYHES